MNKLSLKFIYIAFAIMIIGKLIFWHGHPLFTCSDQAAYLEMAIQIAAGKLPYVDFFEWNPPLIMYLNLIPVILSRLTHAPPIECFNYSIIALCAFSAFMSLHIANKYMSKQQFLVFLPLIFAATFYNLDQTINIGEREHIFIISYLPFLILRGLAWQGKQISKAEAILAGLVAGIGMALKPQFVASAALVEFCFYSQFKTLKTFARSEIVTVAIVFVGYIFGLMLLPTAVWDTYLNQVVPLYISGLSYSSRALIHMLRVDPNYYMHFVHLLITLPVALVFSRYNQWIAPLGIFALSFVFHYIYGDQAWPYRFMPMSASLYMLDGLLIGMLIKKVFERLGLAPFTGFVLSCTIFGTACYSTFNEIKGEMENREGNPMVFDLFKTGYQGSCLSSDFDPLLFSILSQTQIDDSVIFIGNGIDPGYPAILQSGRKAGSRYLFCTLPYIDHSFNQSKDPKWKEMADQVVANYGQDIINNKPAVIYIQLRQMEDLLTQHRFLERFMANYKLAGETDLYKVWTRTGAENSGEAQSHSVSKDATERSKRAIEKQTEVDEHINRLNSEIKQLQSENAQLKQELKKARGN
ncbi:MAG: hypothetical protein WCT03_18790 [Candidatus Obscuribacterales bacterium]|jgi:hypothetical protein